jgi:RNA polymerase sigma-70 factor (ECF subfamily)
LLVSKKTAAGFISGDEKATAEVYQAYRKLLFFLIGSIVGSYQEAEDLFQDTFEKAILSRSAIKKPEGLHYYLCQTAKNLSINYVKKREKTLYCYSFFCEEESEQPGNSTNSFLADLVPFLTTEETSVVTLKTVYGMKLKEIAVLSSKPISTVESIYKRAVSKLKKHYKESK